MGNDKGSSKPGNETSSDKPHEPGKSGEDKPSSTETNLQSTDPARWLQNLPIRLKGKPGPQQQGAGGQASASAPSERDKESAPAEGTAASIAYSDSGVDGDWEWDWEWDTDTDKNSIKEESSDDDEGNQGKEKEEKKGKQKSETQKKENDGNPNGPVDAKDPMPPLRTPGTRSAPQGGDGGSEIDGGVESGDSRGGDDCAVLDTEDDDPAPGIPYIRAQEDFRVPSASESHSEGHWYVDNENNFVCGNYLLDLDALREELRLHFGEDPTVPRRMPEIYRAVAVPARNGTDKRGSGGKRVSIGGDGDDKSEKDEDGDSDAENGGKKANESASEARGCIDGAYTY